MLRLTILSIACFGFKFIEAQQNNIMKFRIKKGVFDSLVYLQIKQLKRKLESEVQHIKLFQFKLRTKVERTIKIENLKTKKTKLKNKMKIVNGWKGKKDYKSDMVRENVIKIDLKRKLEDSLMTFLARVT